MSCDQRCLVELSDGTSICVHEVVAAFPDGLSTERLAAMAGLTKQGVEYQIRGALRRARGRIKT